MEPLLQKPFGGRPNTAASIIELPSFFSSKTPAFSRTLIKSFALCIALSLTFFNASAQFLTPLDTRYDGQLGFNGFIVPNFNNLRNIIWDVRHPEKVINGLKQYQYVRSSVDTNMYIRAVTKGEYFVEFWEDANDQFVRIYASGYFHLKGYYKWEALEPLKGLGSIEKESDVEGWHCYFEKMDPIWGDGHHIFAVKDHKGDTLEVSCTIVKRR